MVMILQALHFNFTSTELLKCSLYSCFCKATEIRTNTSSNTTVFITIEGIISGNPFQFTQSQYNFTVSELAESGTFLGQITVCGCNVVVFPSAYLHR